MIFVQVKGADDDGSLYSVRLNTGALAVTLGRALHSDSSDSGGTALTPAGGPTLRGPDGRVA